MRELKTKLLIRNMSKSALNPREILTLIIFSLEIVLKQAMHGICLLTERIIFSISSLYGFVFQENTSGQKYSKIAM